MLMSIPPSLEQKKKILAQKKARLQKYEALIKIQERKEKLSQKIRVGELAEKAGIHHLDHTTLLGAFLSLKENINDLKITEIWLKKGIDFLESSDSLAKVNNTKILETQTI